MLIGNTVTASAHIAGRARSRECSSAERHAGRNAMRKRNPGARKARGDAFDKDGRRCIAISGNVSDPGFDTALEAA